MKIAYKHLLSFLKENPSLEEISGNLFQLGHEHEIVNNSIFDIELTPNRGDCFSLLGLARDLNAFYSLNDPLPLFEDDIENLEIEFENLSEDFCPKICFLEIEIDSIPQIYNENLSSYFEKLEIKRNNFFTDVSNYISYEMGQPTHCFDKSKINKKLIFMRKECDEDFHTLLDSKIKLEGKNGVFLLDNEIISIAGVMGGKSTSCSTNTKKVLVECAYFEPELMIGKSTKYNLSSDSAHKFERGVDPSIQEKALKRFVKIVEEHSNIKNLKMISFGNLGPKKTLTKDFNKINKVLGTELSNDLMKESLEKIGFEIGRKIQIPYHRHDINSHNDLAEEVARVIGYDNLPNNKIDIRPAELSLENPRIVELREILISSGFSEVINFPFTSVSQDSSLSIDNPLDSNKCFMRTDLKTSLIENLLYNERRQKDSIKLFEFSKIYSNQANFNEVFKIGIIASGRRGHNYKDFSKYIDKKYLGGIFLDYFDQKNIVELTRENLNSKSKSKVFFAEIEIKDLLPSDKKHLRQNFKDNNFSKYVPISEYPSSVRDISFMIEELNADKKVLYQLENTKDLNLKQSFIFDYYFNKDSRVLKIGCRFIFQSKDKTLSEQDINESMQNILKPFLSIKGVSVPGME